jgi:hypothetical protein
MKTIPEVILVVLWLGYLNAPAFAEEATTMTGKTENGRVVLKGVPHESLVYGWDCSLRGLHLLLQHRGETISLDELSVLSGDAFHICFATGPDTYPELLMPIDPLANAASALGYEYEWLITESERRGHLTKTVPDLAQRRALTLAVLRRIQAQIDAGRPALVAGVSHQGCGNWSLVIGYDQAGTELCHNGLDGEPAGTWSPIRGLTAPINDRDGLPGYWNGRPRGSVVPGFSGGWLVNPVFILGDRRDPPGPEEVARTVLQQAVALHQADSAHFFGGQHYFGAEAYRQWIAALPTMDGPADLVLDEVVRGRTAAATFCKRTAQLLPASAAPLMRAAEAYCREVEVARDAFPDFIPFRWDNPARDQWGSATQRTAAAGAVARLLEHERVAVAAIEEALR